MVTPIRAPKAHVQRSVDETETWLTRHQVSDLLGISENTILRWDRQGVFHPRTATRELANGTQKEVLVYDPRELAKAPVKRVVTRAPGDIAARAFEMFDSGETPRAVVVATRELPDRVLELREQWLDMGGVELTVTPESKQQLEDILGASFDGVADLIDLVRARVVQAAP